MASDFIAKYFKAIIIALCLLAILPYFLACWYIHPFFDDYFFASQIHANGLAGFTRYFYLNWSGRYSEEILMAIVNSKIKDASNVQYFLFGLFVLTSLLCSFFYLVHVIFKSYYSLFNKAIIALTVFAFYLAFMPELFTSFYWYCSSYYQLCLSFLLLNIALIINIFKEEKEWIYKINLLFLNVFIAGFSEVTIFSFGILYFAIVVHHYLKYKKIKTYWLLLLLVFCSCAIFNILSPGNFVRMCIAKSGAENGFIFSSLRAVYDLILFHGVYTFFKTPFLFFCILFLSLAISYLKSGIPLTKIFNVNPLYSIIVTLLIFYLQHALSIYGAGYSLQGRVFNFSIFLFYLAFAYNLLVVLYYFSGKITTPSFKINPLAAKWLMIVIVFLFNFSDNNRLLWGDLARELPAFQKQLTERYELIENAKKNGAKEVEVPLVKAMPKLYIFGEDARCKAGSFANEQKFLDEAGSFFKIIIKTKE
jgi:hypothetical protein